MSARNHAWDAYNEDPHGRREDVERAVVQAFVVSVEEELETLASAARRADNPALVFAFTLAGDRIRGLAEGWGGGR